MYTEKIVNRQLFFFLFIQRTTIVISFLPALTSAEALQDAWIAGVLALLPSAAMILFIGKLAIIFPDKSIVQYSQELVGPLLGKFLSLFYLFMFLLMAATDLRIYAEVIKTGFMPETPIVVVMGIMMLAAVIVVYAGLEPLGRCVDVIFSLFVIMLLGSLFFSLMHADFRNLQPVLSKGWSPVIMGAITPTIISAQYTNMVMIVPSVDEPQKSLRAALWSILFSSLALVLFCVVVVSVLGADEGARAAFPVFKMIRSTRISEFLERVEALTILAWGLGLFITASVNLYSGSKGLSQLLGLKDNRPLILPMSVIWVAFGIQIYKDYFEVKQFFRPEMVAPVVFFIVLFPVTVLWVAYLLKRPGIKQSRR
jgi:spore germination protein KB